MTVTDVKFIENPAFLKWVFNPTPDIEHYWEQYLIENPEEKSRLLELKHHLSELRFSNDTLRDSEKKNLADRIIKNLNQNLRHNKRQFILRSFMKYAAVAIIFTAIGSLLVYLNSNKESFFQQEVAQIVQIPSASQGPKLITSNGKNVDLKKSKSN